MTAIASINQLGNFDIIERPTIFTPKKGKTTNEAILWVPTDRVNVVKLKVSKKTKEHFLPKILPFMLEEHIIGEVEKNKIAHSQLDKNYYVSAAITKNEVFENWQTIADSNNFNPTKIYLDIFAIPENETGWSVFIVDEDYIIVRKSKYEGFSGSFNWVMQILLINIEKNTIDVQIHNPNNYVVIEPLQQYVTNSTLTLSDYFTQTPDIKLDFNKQTKLGLNSVMDTFINFRKLSISIVAMITLYMINIFFNWGYSSNQIKLYEQSLIEEVNTIYPQIEYSEELISKIEEDYGTIQSIKRQIQSTPWSKYFHDVNKILNSGCNKCYIQRIQIKPNSLKVIIFSKNNQKELIQIIKDNYEHLKISTSSNSKGSVIEIGNVTSVDEEKTQDE